MKPYRIPIGIKMVQTERRIESMNSGKFLVRYDDPEKGTEFRPVSGYIIVKDNVRFGIYRSTAAGASYYNAVDLRDGYIIADGYVTLHQCQRQIDPPVPTSELAEDPNRARELTELFEALLTCGEPNITWPTY